jgi:hypothetical protein
VEARLDHGSRFTVPTESESSIDSFQFAEKETYYYITLCWTRLFVRGLGYFWKKQEEKRRPLEAQGKRAAALQSSKREPSLLPAADSGQTPFVGYEERSFVAMLLRTGILCRIPG